MDLEFSLKRKYINPILPEWYTNYRLRITKDDKQIIVCEV